MVTAGIAGTTKSSGIEVVIAGSRVRSIDFLMASAPSCDNGSSNADAGADGPNTPTHVATTRPAASPKFKDDEDDAASALLGDCGRLACGSEALPLGSALPL